ncbi:MAG: choice-of-anchor D domain-containing protein [bacterium]
MAPLSIGAATTNSAPFQGLIDEVRVSMVDRQPWEFNVSRSNLFVKEDTLFFGTILQERNRSIPIYISNQGGEPLEITDISSPSEQISFSPQVTGTSTLSVAAGQNEVIWASYTAQGKGEFSSTITIASNDPTFPEKTIPFKGKIAVSPELGAYKTDPFTLGLWHFNYWSGPVGRMVIPDSSGYGMDGIWNGFTPGTAVARFDKAIFLDGNDDFCYMDSVGGHPLYARWGGFTVEGWFYLESSTAVKQYLIKRGYDDANQFGLYLNGDYEVVGYMYNKNKEKFEVTSTEPLELKKWYHLALVWHNDSLLTLYVDGSVSSDISVTGELISRTKAIDTLSVMVGGNWKNNDCFNGFIDEVRLSSVPRSPWEFSVRSASIMVSSTEINFGKVIAGEERTLKYWISNGSKEDTLKIWPVDLENLDYFSVPAGTLKVSPYEDQSEMKQKALAITFNPPNAGNFTEELSFISNDPSYLNDNFKVTLKGEGFTTRLTTAYETDLFTSALYNFEEGEGGTFTSEFWFNLNAIPTNTYNMIMDVGEGDTNKIRIFYHWQYGLVAKITDSKGQVIQLQTDNLEFFITQQWYHCALTCDGDSLKLYLNNRCMDKKALINQINFIDIGSLRFGNEDQGTTNYFTGIIDEFRFSTIEIYPREYNVAPRTLVVAPQQIQPQQIQFPPVRTGSSKSLDLWIANEGDEFLNTTIITGSENELTLPDSLTQNDRLDTTLLGNSYLKIPVVYTPVTEEISDAWIITSNDPENETVTINITGSSTSSLKVVPYITDIHTIALYHLNNLIQANIIEDVSEYDNDGSLINGSIGEGYFNNGVEFNGRNSRIEVPYSETLAFDFNNDNFTLECFFKTDTVSQTLISRGVETANSDVNYWIYINGQGRITVDGLGTFGQNVNDNAWHHLAVSYNRFTEKGSIFIDGELIKQKLWNDIPINLDQKSLIIGAHEQAGGVFSGFFKGNIDEVRISNVSRSKLEFSLGDFMDEFDLKITSTNPGQPSYNERLILDINVSNELNAETVTLYYRAGGSTVYSNVTASPLSGSTYRCTLPGDEVMLTGIEYYISITNGQETLTSPRIDPEDNPNVLTVHNEGLKAPLVIPHREWTMFSIPFDLDDNGVNNVLVDDLGSYSRYMWKVYAWIEGQYRLCIPPDFYFNPGEAYWIQTHLEQTFDIEGGSSITTGTNFEITLDSSAVDTNGFSSGWNMVGIPFNFPVDWQDCSVSSESVKGPYFWDGQQYIPSENIKTLEPWKGYFFCNQSVKKATLIIPPEWGKYDQPEPPPIENNISLYFCHNNWGQYNGHYCSDYQKIGAEGHIWNFRVEDNTDTEMYELQCTLYNSLPEDWKAYIFDLDRGIAKNILEDNKWDISYKDKRQRLHTYTLVVGTEEFIRENSDNIPLIPVKFELSQNFPNPFNNNTLIRYGLPENSRVEIVIYNSLGQKVRELINEEQKSGVHIVKWDGRDGTGLYVASGVYIYRFKALSKIKVRKMVFIK